MNARQDISTRDDIIRLVDGFYEKLIADKLIGKFFNEVIDMNWEEHMPVMYDFWDSMLLGAAKYQGNPMRKHLELNIKEPLLPEHFERWLCHWERSVNSLFSGPKALEAITRATDIARLMEYKVSTP